MRLRPMAPGQLADNAIQTFQSMGKDILALTLLPTFLSFLGLVFIQEFVIPRMVTTSDPTSLGTQISEVFVALVVAVAVAAPLFLIGIALINGLVISMVSDYVCGRVPDLAAAKSNATRLMKKLFIVSLAKLGWSFASLVVAGLMLAFSAWLSQNNSSDVIMAFSGMVALLGFVLFFLLLVLQIGRYSLAYAAAFHENLGAVAATKRSADLLKSRGMVPSGYDALRSAEGLMLFIGFLLLMGLGTIIGILSLNELLPTAGETLGIRDLVEVALALLPTFLVLWLMQPIWATATTLIYFDRRFRLEAYDVELLAQDVWRTHQQARFQL